MLSAYLATSRETCMYTHRVTDEKARALGMRVLDSSTSR